jgi:hypothetical protein
MLAFSIFSLVLSADLKAAGLARAGVGVQRCARLRLSFVSAYAADLVSDVDVMFRGEGCTPQWTNRRAPAGHFGSSIARVLPSRCYKTFFFLCATSVV